MIHERQCVNDPKPGNHIQIENECSKLEVHNVYITN